MKNMLKAFAFVSILAVFITGCGVAPINNISTPISIKESNKNIESSILYGVVNANWEVIKIKEGLLRARHSWRDGKHVIYVNIPYSDKEYKIEYFNSINLNYDAEKNTIHSSYKTFTNRLNEFIRVAIANKSVYYGVVDTRFSINMNGYLPKNEFNEKYNIYYYNTNKNFVSKNRDSISTLKAKTGFGFIRIDQQKLFNEFKNGFTTFTSKQKMVDYIYMRPGKHEVVLGDNRSKMAYRIDTLIFATKPGHDYLFDYNIKDNKLAYWVQDLTTNKRVIYKKNTAFRDKAFFNSTK